MSTGPLSTTLCLSSFHPNSMFDTWTSTSKLAKILLLEFISHIYFENFAINVYNIMLQRDSISSNLSDELFRILFFSPAGPGQGNPGHMMVGLSWSDLEWRRLRAVNWNIQKGIWLNGVNLESSPLSLSKIDGKRVGFIFYRMRLSLWPS